MIHFVTDSSADIPRHLLEKHTIHSIPLSIHVNGKDFAEGVDITPQEFYQEMALSPELPKTSQPSPAQFAKVFQELTGKGKVLCFTISSKLSGSFNAAVMGKELSGNPDVTVFDTLAGSLGHGLQVLKAVELFEQEQPFHMILSRLNTMREEMKFLILLDTLENVVKGGRLSRFQGTLAKVLDIKAILHVIEGRVEILERIRGRSRSMKRIIELVGDRCTDFSDKIIGVTHVNNLNDARTVASELEKRYRPREIIINETGATIATYAGKDGIIVAF
ncbi:DegV family protein [Dehalobacter sp. DCM]|uniref:DegV family protein n=1 Tax=Dehalobacter sp. DCM TaxID=2907827 RepID=UPI0030813E7F|nr:DegV family protein [Dehalobacter sp. DCM]